MSTKALPYQATGACGQGPPVPCAAKVMPSACTTHDKIHQGPATCAAKTVPNAAMSARAQAAQHTGPVCKKEAQHCQAQAASL